MLAKTTAGANFIAMFFGNKEAFCGMKIAIIITTNRLLFLFQLKAQ